MTKTCLVPAFVWMLSACATPHGSGSDSATLPGEAVDEPSTWSVRYIDPSALNNGTGLTEESPANSLETWLTTHPATASGTKIALKRGTVTRLTGTLNLRGGGAGWISWGAYGSPSDPKPIVVGSVTLASADWTDADGDGVWQTAWPAGTVEQGPGNLWFFSADTEAAMTGWGWRKPALSAVGHDRDWFYDPSGWLHLKTLAAPPVTEVAVNRTGISFSGQSGLIVEDWDLRYFGGYILRGHAASHLRFRRLDLSFSGGGTKAGQYVRLGNGLETNGNIDDVIVEDCRFHQLYDTAFDPQDVGTQLAVQTRLTYRRNTISRMGLAGVELWMRTTAQGSRLADVAIRENTFVGTGTGWGFEQHDHPGQAQVGADLVIFNNTASTERISVTDNLFHGSRLVLMAEFGSSRLGNLALLAALTLDRNTWSRASISTPAVVLFQGAVGSDGVATLGASPTFATLGEWKSNSLVPGKDLGSTEEIRTPPQERTATRFGPFAQGP